MGNNARKNKLYVDKEIRLFYWTVAGIPVALTVLALFEHEWWLALLLLGVVLIILSFGWPLKAIINERYEVTFVGPIRRSRVTAQNLVSVKADGIHDYRAHIVLRVRHGLPIGYRCRQYTNAPILARTVLDLINKSPDAVVADDATKLLNWVVGGKTTSLK